MSETILVIDADPSAREAIAAGFPDFVVRAVGGIDAAVEALHEATVELVVLVVREGSQVAAAVQRLRVADVTLPVALIGADIQAEAVLAARADIQLSGALSIDRVRLALSPALARRRLERQVARMSGRPHGRLPLTAQSATMKRVMALIKRVATYPSTTVLMQGESGVGKEHVARVIHERSSRAAKPFLVVSCAPLDESQLEHELFGSNKSVNDPHGHAGAFEAADGGTVYLDELADLPLGMQMRLLRVLQDRRVRRIGGTHDIEIDVRIIAASCRDLRVEINSGRLRQDLYFRLRVMPIRVPSLRERPEDILPLADHLLQRIGPELGRPDLRLSPMARETMRSYAWPGNVRELANAIERAVIGAENSEIVVADLCMDEQLPAPTAAGNTPTAIGPMLPEGALIIPPGERDLGRVEALVIRAALEESGGHKSKAADVLGINRTTLYNKLRELNLMAKESIESSDTWPAVKVGREPGQAS